MALTGAHAPGATPLTEEELAGLLIPTVRTHAELNDVEAANIIRGQEWALRARTARMPDMLTDEFIQQLHRQMLGNVWRWAGDYRNRDTNIGVERHLIRPSLRQLYDDANGWLVFKSYPPDEFAVRLHHRLVSVHPFPNGNGRHARLLAHLVMVRHFELPPLPWGGSQLSAADRSRQIYIEALVAADRHDYAPLLAFARSNS